MNLLKSKYLKKQRAFSLVEILLVISLMLLIAFFTIPLTVSVLDTNKVETTQSVLVEALRNGSLYARDGREDDSWGVKIEQTEIIVFKGSEYQSRDPLYDQVYTKSSQVIINGTDLISFEKLTGTPSYTGTISISGGNQSRLVNINLLGAIDGD